MDEQRFFRYLRHQGTYHPEDGILDLSGVELAPIWDFFYLLPEEIESINLSRTGISTIPQGILTRAPPGSTLEEQYAMIRSLKDIDLSDNNFTTFPMELTLLDDLEELDLSGNRITEIPPEISRMASLDALYLRNNQIRTFPSSIGEMKSLRVLDLDHNPLQELPEELGDVETMEDLGIMSTGLPTLPGKIVENIQNIDFNEERDLHSLPKRYRQMLTEGNETRVPIENIALVYKNLAYLVSSLAPEYFWFRRAIKGTRRPGIFINLEVKKFPFPRVYYRLELGDEQPDYSTFLGLLGLALERPGFSDHIVPAEEIPRDYYRILVHVYWGMGENSSVTIPDQGTYESYAEYERVIPLKRNVRTFSDLESDEYLRDSQRKRRRR